MYEKKESLPIIRSEVTRAIKCLNASILYL